MVGKRLATETGARDKVRVSIFEARKIRHVSCNVVMFVHRHPRLFLRRYHRFTAGTGSFHLKERLQWIKTRRREGKGGPG